MGFVALAAGARTLFAARRYGGFMSWRKETKIGALLQLDESLGGDAFPQCMKLIQDRYGAANLIYVCASFRGHSFSKPFVRTTYPVEWMEHYSNERYERIDPIVRAGARSMVPVEWRSLPRTTKKIKRMFSEAAEAGVGKEGLIIPLRGPANIWAFLNVTSHETGQAWDAWRNEFMGEFMLMASQLHEQACALHGIADIIDLDAISGREREAVAWVADGKSVEEIGMLMGCSEHTVKYYLDSARIKLGANNRTHMVVMAIRAGLVS